MTTDTALDVADVTQTTPDRVVLIELAMHGRDMNVAVQTPDGKLDPKSPVDLLAWFISQSAGDLIPYAVTAYQRSVAAQPASNVIEVPQS